MGAMLAEALRLFRNKWLCLAALLTAGTLWLELGAGIELSACGTGEEQLQAVENALCAAALTLLHTSFEVKKYV